jgi:hypothetical protein
VGAALRDQKNLDPEIARWAKSMCDLRAEEDEIPPDWYREDELAEKLGMSGSGVRPYIKLLLDRGKLESKKFRRWIEGRTDRRYSVAYYKLK